MSGGIPGAGKWNNRFVRMSATISCARTAVVCSSRRPLERGFRITERTCRKQEWSEQSWRNSRVRGAMPRVAFGVDLAQRFGLRGARNGTRGWQPQRANDLQTPSTLLINPGHIFNEFGATPARLDLKVMSSREGECARCPPHSSRPLMHHRRGGVHVHPPLRRALLRRRWIACAHQRPDTQRSYRL